MEGKKYKCIAKVGSDKFIKHNVNNLLLYTAWLDRKFPDWRWFNVYRYTKNGDGEQLDNFTKNSRPRRRYL